MDPHLFPPSTTNTTIQQCIDPANFDVYTGRMAYSFCWRYACLPPVFASYPFRAVCKDLERWWVAHARVRAADEIECCPGSRCCCEGGRLLWRVCCGVCVVATANNNSNSNPSTKT